MLTVIASPIGSIEELSLQAGKALATADIVLCEDTRTFVPFLKSIATLYNLTLNPNQKIISYYKDVEFRELPKVINYLEEGKNVVLISEAGTPLVSDPGKLLIETCQKREISYTSIPGSSASINAGVLAGCRFENFLIVGFLPKKATQIENQLRAYQEISKTLKHFEICIFESPHRINATLEIINQILPETTVCICREMNKRFEEIKIGKARELSKFTYKGELTYIIKF